MNNQVFVDNWLKVFIIMGNETEEMEFCSIIIPCKGSGM